MHSFRYVGKELFCEDVSLAALARKHGTPLYVYSQATLTDHYRKLHGALDPLDRLVCFTMTMTSVMAGLYTAPPAHGPRITEIWGITPLACTLRRKMSA